MTASSRYTLQDNDLSVCRDCGALVGYGRRDTHDQHHDWLTGLLDSHINLLAAVECLVGRPVPTGRPATPEESHAGLRDAMATLGVSGDRNPDMADEVAHLLCGPGPLDDTDPDPFPVTDADGAAVDDGTAEAYRRAEARIAQPDDIHHAMGGA